MPTTLKAVQPSPDKNFKLGFCRRSRRNSNSSKIPQKYHLNDDKIDVKAKNQEITKDLPDRNAERTAIPDPQCITRYRTDG